MSGTAQSRNSLLAALPQKTYQHLLPKLERIDLTVAERLYSPGEAFTHVYFIESGIVAMLVVVDDQSTLEVSMVGNEGMVGLPVFFGIKTSKNRVVVQGVGSAQKIKVADFKEECTLGNELAKIMHQFTYSIVTQISRTAGCNRFHAVEARLARWLLMTQDRMKSSEFQITQEFMSFMLGVRREAVSKAAASFRQRQMIKYSRGNFSILDRKGLEAVACNCYQFITAN